MAFKPSLNLKPGKSFLEALVLLAVIFLFSSLSLFVGFVLKALNPSEYGLIQGNKQDLEITYKEVLFFTTVVLAFFLFSHSYRRIQKKALKLFLIIFAVTYLTASFFIIAIDVIYYLIFAYRLTFSAVQTVLNTNPGEAQGFIILYTTTARVATIFAFVALYILLIVKRKKLITLLSTNSFYYLSLVVSVFGILDFAQVAYSKSNGPHNVRYWDIIIGDYNQFNQFQRDLVAEAGKQNYSKEYDGFYKQDTLNKTLVFVVSESLSKRHMSFYGYARQTTPHLDTNKNIYRYNNCVTNAALTIEAVPSLFFNGYFKKKINLISLANKLGFETTWISNQSGWGKGDKTIVLLSQLCNKSWFSDKRSDNDIANSSFHYDEEILPYFEQTLKKTSSRSKLIVVHLMGCHFEYEKRFPANRNFFKSLSPAKTAISNQNITTVLNAYDNAVLYHDSIINQLYSLFTLNCQAKNAAFVFVADHGEELYELRDHAGHGYPPNRITSEIPYFVGFSKGFKNNYPGVDSIAKTRANTPYTSSKNFYTLVNLLNISSPAYKNNILKHAFFSPIYDSTSKRLVMNIDYSAMTN